MKQRKSIRLRTHDYRGAGAYFFTVVVEERAHALGEIIDGEMRLNAFGEIVLEEWWNKARVRDDVELDAFVVMPNHIHGICTW